MLKTRTRNIQDSQNIMQNIVHHRLKLSVLHWNH